MRRWSDTETQLTPSAQGCRGVTADDGGVGVFAPDRYPSEEREARGELRSRLLTRETRRSISDAADPATGLEEDEVGQRLSIGGALHERGDLLERA